MMKKLLLLLLAIAASLLIAQAQSGELKGVITDVHNEPVPFANVAVYHNTQLITGGVANIDGEYSIKPVTEGCYDIETSAVGYIKQRYTGIQIQFEKITVMNAVLTSDGKPIGLPCWGPPLMIQKDQSKQGASWNRKDILRSP